MTLNILGHNGTTTTSRKCIAINNIRQQNFYWKEFTNKDQNLKWIKDEDRDHTVQTFRVCANSWKLAFGRIKAKVSCKNVFFIWRVKRWPVIKMIKMQSNWSPVICLYPACVDSNAHTHEANRKGSSIPLSLMLWICRETLQRTIIARKPRQTTAGCVCRQLTGPSWTMRQWETSWAHRRGLRSQRQWFPCQQDLCWESPPFKRFPSRTSATEGLVGIGEGISCGWQMKMQLWWSKMETARVESPTAAAAAAAAELCMDPCLSFTLWHFDYCLLSSIQSLHGLFRTVQLLKSSISFAVITVVFYAVFLYANIMIVWVYIRATSVRFFQADSNFLHQWSHDWTYILKTH